jgi:hypothetical protein
LVGFLEEGAAARESATRSAAAGRKQMIRALVICTGLLLAAATGFAQTPAPATNGGQAGTAPPAAPTPRAWSTLSPQQQQLLQSHQGDWDSLPADRQQALAKGSQRWLSMTPEQRSSAQQRFTQWRAMPPEQRQLVRQRWQQFKRLPPEQQQQVRESFQRFRQMPPERRMELRRQWNQMTPEQRRRAVQHASGEHGTGPHGLPPPRHVPR